MNKVELIEKVADKTGLTKKNVGNVVGATREAISNALTEGERVTLVGFGTFQVVQGKARRGRNPQTGDEIQIRAKGVPKFVPRKGLKEKVGCKEIK